MDTTGWGTMFGSGTGTTPTNVLSPLRTAINATYNVSQGNPATQSRSAASPSRKSSTSTSGGTSVSNVENMPVLNVSHNNPTKLFKMIKKKDWSNAIQRCAEKPDEASVWIVELNVDGSVRWKMLPIHQACEMRPPSKLIEALLRSYPKGVEMKDSGGDLAIHLACRERASETVVSTLLTLYPRSAQMKDDEGRLPLHLACRQGVDLDVVTKVLLKYYSGSKVTDKYGLLPLHWACSQNASDAVVESLLRAFPASGSAKDKWGRTAMSLAQASNNKCKEKILKALSKDESYWTTSLVNEIATLKAQVIQNIAAEKALKQRIGTLGSRLDKVTSASTAAATEHEEEKEELIAEMESLKEIADEKSRLLETTGNRAASLSVTVNDLTSNTESQEKLVMRLKVENDDLSTKNVDFESSVNKLTMENGDLRTRNSDLEKKLNNLSSLIQFIKEDQTQITQAAGRLERALTEALDVAEYQVPQVEVPLETFEEGEDVRAQYVRAEYPQSGISHTRERMSFEEGEEVLLSKDSDSTPDGPDTRGFE